MDIQEHETDLEEDDKYFDFSFRIYGLLINDGIKDFEKIFGIFYSNLNIKENTLMDNTLCYIKYINSSRIELLIRFLNEWEKMFKSQKKIILEQDKILLKKSIFNDGDYETKIKLIFKHFVDYIVLEYRNNNEEIPFVSETSLEYMYYSEFLKIKDITQKLFLRNFKNVYIQYESFVTLYVSDNYKLKKKYVFIYIPFDKILFEILKQERKNNYKNLIELSNKENYNTNILNFEKMHQEILNNNFKLIVMAFMGDFFANFPQKLDIDYMIMPQLKRYKLLVEFFISNDFKFTKYDKIYIQAFETAIKKIYATLLDELKPKTIFIYKYN